VIEPTFRATNITLTESVLQSTPTLVSGCSLDNVTPVHQALILEGPHSLEVVTHLEVAVIEPTFRATNITLTGWVLHSTPGGPIGSRRIPQRSLS